jgi:methyl-accepting chemotaxis protein
MKSTKANVSAEINQSLEMEVTETINELRPTSDTFHRVENDDDEVAANSLSVLLRRASEVSTGEIENLIDEFHGLREKLQTDLSRIQRDIAKYRELSQGVTQLGTSISDGMKKLPGGPGG